MVHFAYSHIAFFTLLALTAINSGESTSKDAISARLAKIKGEIPGIITAIKNSEVKVKNATDIILKKKPHLQGDMKKFTDCLEYAYKYYWGFKAFNNTLNFFPEDPHKKLVDAKNCIQQETLEYKKIKEAFHPKKCYGYSFATTYGDITRFMSAEFQLYNHKHMLTIKIYGKILNENLLKGL
ncbi:unnamed protein product [Trichobilharzia szidati]|nr:unnamed protein product [Trichobilharzia szidati]